MTIETTAPDSLSIDTVKEHILVYHNEDDAILQHYIKASLNAVNGYMHSSTLLQTYVNTAQEVAYVTPDGYYDFKIGYTPYKVEVNGTELMPNEFKNYNARVRISEDLIPPGATVKAYVGFIDDISEINQARLLLIGSWYSHRENTSTLSINELPDGVKFILDNISDVSV